MYQQNEDDLVKVTWDTNRKTEQNPSSKLNKGFIARERGESPTAMSLKFIFYPF